jgi:hypothetical protein
MAWLINTFTIITVRQSPTAALMSPRTPFCVYGACTGRKYTDIPIFVIARSSSYWGQSKRLNVAARESDCENGLSWMESLSEKLRRERECAEILEHSCCQGMIQWVVGDGAEALDWAGKLGEAEI